MPRKVKIKVYNELGEELKGNPEPFIVEVPGNIYPCPHWSRIEVLDYDSSEEES